MRVMLRVGRGVLFGGVLCSEVEGILGVGKVSCLEKFFSLQKEWYTWGGKGVLVQVSF